MSVVKPMLAVQAQEIRFPVYASAKIDGIRALHKDGKLMSRKMLPIPNHFTQSVFSNVQFHGLDGELTVGPPNAKDVMQQTTSGVMTREGSPDVTWWVFDYWTVPNKPFDERFREMLEYFTPAFQEAFPRVKLLPQTLIHTQEQLDDFEKAIVDAGFEGVMVRDPQGPYKYGRSTAKQGILLKLKRFVDDEAIVTGFEELMHNGNELQRDELGYAKRSSHKDNKISSGMLGSLIGRDMRTGAEVRCGTGFTQEMRRKIWSDPSRYMNKIFVYKHFAVTGVKDARRFSVFKSFRDPRDMG